jgi:hypothetical protein
MLGEDEGLKVVPLAKLHGHAIIQDEHLLDLPGSLGMGRCPGELGRGRLGQIGEERFERRGETGLIGLVAHGYKRDDLGDGVSFCRRVAERDLEALLASRFPATGGGKGEGNREQNCSCP